MTARIKKIVISLDFSDDSFFPLTSAVPKELLPLGEDPLIHSLVNEGVDCRAEEVLFILPSEKKEVLNHFKNMEKSSREDDEFKEKYSEISFYSVTRKKGAGSGYSLFRAKEKIGEDVFGLSFSGAIFQGKRPSLEQLFSVYRTSQKQVAALRRVEGSDSLKSPVVEAEKIANRIYKIKKIVEDPSEREEESRLVLAGRYILTSAIFDYLKNSGEKTTVEDALNRMIASGKSVYGHECDGEWVSLRDKEDYFKAQKALICGEQ